MTHCGCSGYRALNIPSQVFLRHNFVLNYIFTPHFLLGIPLANCLVYFSQCSLVTVWQCSSGDSCSEGTHQNSPETVGGRSNCQPSEQGDDYNLLVWVLHVALTKYYDCMCMCRG